MEDFKCVKGQSCLHCGSTYCRFVDELDQLKAENEQLKKQIESDKGLITDAGKQNYQLVQEYNRLKVENEELKEELAHIQHNCTREGCKYYDNEDYKVFYRCKAEQKLEQIREIAKVGMHCNGIGCDFMPKVLEIIDEVE